MRRLAGAAWRVLAGALLCQNPLLSLAASGWAYRLAKDGVLKRWRRAAGSPEPPEPWPEWIGRKPPGRAFWANFKTGAQVAFNTYVMTVPGCVLWMFAWYDGWNNSFHKGYEQAWVGPALGLLGTAFFVGAMFYVPMAQARQAATGEWRAFYHFRTVREVVRARWASCLALAGLYAAVSLPVTLLAFLPNFLPAGLNPPEGFTDARALIVLRRYHFAAACFVFPIFTGLRLAAARVYASGLLEAVRSGVLDAGDLGAWERAVAGELGLLRAERGVERHVLLRAIGWAGTRAGRLVSTAGTALFWLAVVAQTFAAQFLNYRRQGWLVLPLVHAPYLRYIPPHLRSLSN